jgi:hypothetical protein
VNKRQHFYEKIEEAKERYRDVPTDVLEARLPLMSIKECIIAAKAVIAERQKSEISN